MAKNKKQEPLEIDCTFGSFSYGGKKTARLGIAITKDSITPTRCESFLVNSRLNVTLRFDPADLHDADGQQKLDDIGEIHIRSVVDIKGYHSAEQITAGLTFMHNSLEDADIVALNKIAGKTGTMVAEYIGQIPDKEVIHGDADEEEEEESEQMELEVVGSAR